MFCKTPVQKYIIYPKIQRKCLRWSLFLIKQVFKFIKTRLRHIFPCESSGIFQNAFFSNNFYEWLLLKTQNFYSEIAAQRINRLRCKLSINNLYFFTHIKFRSKLFLSLQNFFSTRHFSPLLQDAEFTAGIYLFKISSEKQQNNI